jgi:outer membrane lipoprotein LolB
MLLAGCAQLPRSGVSQPPLENLWSGRLALQVQSEPPQSLSAAFELKGTAAAGELRLSTPLGTTLLSARWSAVEALLEAGNEVRRFPDIDTLLLQATGASVPVSALFDWLKGTPSQADGWTADLSRYADGRIMARRESPAPAGQLRIVLDAL